MTTDKKSYYLTTPLYYVNGKPHIGHAYTTVVADTLARYHRLKGEDVFFLTGTDEHGQKVEGEARSRGVKTQELVDEMALEFKDVWQKLGITFDRFIRTTESAHIDTVQKLIRKIYDNGYIYPGDYQGWYCTPCETYWTEEQMDEGKVCPDCKRPTAMLSEKSYFFKLSAFAEPLLRLIEKNPNFVRPATRLNEIVSFIKMGLNDLSISRSSFEWGIPVPFDEDYIIYVWFDALINYISGVDYLNEGDVFKKYWPADVHLIGKDIIKFHAVIWPAMLMAAGLEPPKQIYAHGWWTTAGGKMSKSRGNVIDPMNVVDEYGVDIFRYFILREIPFGLDGSFTKEALILRTNADLANDLGNLLHRSGAMLKKYSASRLTRTISSHPDDRELIKRAVNLPGKVDEKMADLQFSLALKEIWEVIGLANKYIDTMAPWKLFKSGQHDRLDEVMYNIFELLRIVCIMISPFIPGTAEELWSRIGNSDSLAKQTFANAGEWGKLPYSATVSVKDPLFPRIEV